ncbi:MAG: NAD-dependent epimerase/dehydratase family protein [Nanoarchaeota archaeon]|nr:NAD-dependent epimerase/dehydratase family protein [Nanoarchaeota archaeon]
MINKKILIIGGTGILGKAIISESLKEKAKITVMGLSKNKSIPKEVNQVVVNRKDKTEFKQVVNKLNQKEEKWDIVLDIADWAKEDAEQTYELFKNYAKHFFIISTTLVYDRSKPCSYPIKTNYPLSKKGVLGGYVDNKLDIENFWKGKKEVNWTILRPYHILNPSDSLLGCIPEHNRDPKLLARIKSNEPLILCNGGDIKFNFIDARDIAKIILKSTGNSKTHHKIYNAVNPTIVLAKDYYELIGNELGKKVIIKNKPIQEVWKENKGWQLTTLPHIYDVSDLKKDIEFVPNISINESLKEAIKSPILIDKPVSEIPVHQRMTLLPRPKPINWLLEN